MYGNSTLHPVAETPPIRKFVTAIASACGRTLLHFRSARTSSPGSNEEASVLTHFSAFLSVTLRPNCAAIHLSRSNEDVLRPKLTATVDNKPEGQYRSSAMRMGSPRELTLVAMCEPGCRR